MLDGHEARMSGYPAVAGEYQTVCKIIAGYSIARIGDGELKLMCGAGINREPANVALQNELIDVALYPHPRCIVGVWTYDPRGPKFMNMLRHKLRFQSVLSPDVKYYSSFISRPDCAPWIAHPQYALLLERAWADKRVAIVCQRKGSVYAPVRRRAKSCTHIECPTHEAYARIGELEQAVVDAAPDVAILSAGATATCLANRLAARGIQAIDLGSIGKFLHDMLRQAEAEPAAC